MPSHVPRPFYWKYYNTARGGALAPLYCTFPPGGKGRPNEFTAPAYEYAALHMVGGIGMFSAAVNVSHGDLSGWGMNLCQRRHLRSDGIAFFCWEDYNCFLSYIRHHRTMNLEPEAIFQRPRPKGRTLVSVQHQALSPRARKPRANLGTDANPRPPHKGARGTPFHFLSPSFHTCKECKQRGAPNCNIIRD